MAGDTIIYPYCYATQEILDNGPLRFTVRLVYHPLVVRGDSGVIETRVITLDAGSHLNKTIVSYTNLKETMPLAVGIVLHEPDGAVVANAAEDTSLMWTRRIMRVMTTVKSLWVLRSLLW